MSSDVDYSDLPALIPNIPMEMYYGDDEDEMIRANEYDSVQYKGIELIDYVNDFIDNQNNYFELIKSYCNGNCVEIYIQNKGTVVSAGFLKSDNKVHELLRDIIDVDNNHDTIWKWVNDYYGKVVSGNELVNRVYIGQNFVPLCQILLDAYEEDNNNIVSLPEEEPMNDRFTYGYISIVIVGVLIIAFLFMINLI